jgi:hypothetical protein
MRGGQNLFGVKACGGVGTCTTTGPSKCDCAVHTVARCAPRNKFRASSDGSSCNGATVGAQSISCGSSLDCFLWPVVGLLQLLAAPFRCPLRHARMSPTATVSHAHLLLHRSARALITHCATPLSSAMHITPAPFRSCTHHAVHRCALQTKRHALFVKAT